MHHENKSYAPWKQKRKQCGNNSLKEESWRGPGKLYREDFIERGPRRDLNRCEWLQNSAGLGASVQERGQVSGEVNWTNQKPRSGRVINPIMALTPWQTTDNLTMWPAENYSDENQQLLCI